MPILLVLVLAAVAFAVGYGVAALRRKPEAPQPPSALPPAALPAAPAPQPPAPVATPDPRPEAPAAVDGAVAERARIIRSLESETHALRRALGTRDAAAAQLADFAADRRRLLADLAVARGETARYRQLVVDLENDAPPPLFGTDAPDDLKLIVGIGPVLERMLHQLGIATYRQIARWSEREIDEIDAKLHEFPGRIRRDAWVTQARELHQSKYGETLPARGR